MSLNLESIQEMWEKDSKIDVDNQIGRAHV